MTRPRRSHLFMPGSNARALEKARNLAADGLILDLEDSVAPDAKAVARERSRGGRGQGVRQARDADPHQQPRHALVGRRRRDGRQGLAGRHSGAQEFQASRISTGDRRAPEPSSAPPPSVKVWAMIETARAVLDADRAGRRRPRSEDAARRLRVRPERHRARDADQDAAGPRGDDPDDHPLRAGGARPWPRNARRPLQRHRQSRRLRHRMRAGPRPRLRRQDADPSEPDRGLQRDLHAAGGGSRRARARSSRRSNCRRMSRAARSSSTAQWWSGCMPRWRSARSRSRMRSRR